MAVHESVRTASSCARPGLRCRRAARGQILVRKAFPNRRRREKPRTWKLQRLAVGAPTAAGAPASEKKREGARSGSVPAAPGAATASPR